MTVIPNGYDPANDALFQAIQTNVLRDVFEGRKLGFYSVLVDFDDNYYGSDLLVQFLTGDWSEEEDIDEDDQRAATPQPMDLSQLVGLRMPHPISVDLQTHSSASDAPINTPETSTTSTMDGDSEWDMTSVADGSDPFQIQRMLAMSLASLPSSPSTHALGSTINTASIGAPFYPPHRVSAMEASVAGSGIMPPVGFVSQLPLRPVHTPPPSEPQLPVGEFRLDLRAGTAPIKVQYLNGSNGRIERLLNGVRSTVQVGNKRNGNLKPLLPPWISTRIPPFPEIEVSPKQLDSTDPRSSSELSKEMSKAPVNQMINIFHSKRTREEHPRKVISIIPARIVQYARLLLVYPVKPDGANSVTIRHLARWVYRCSKVALKNLGKNPFPQKSQFLDNVCAYAIDLATISPQDPTYVRARTINSSYIHYSSRQPELEDLDAWFMVCLLQEYLKVALTIARHVYIETGGDEKELPLK